MCYTCWPFIYLWFSRKTLICLAPNHWYSDQDFRYFWLLGKCFLGNANISFLTAAWHPITYPSSSKFVNFILLLIMWYLMQAVKIHRVRFIVLIQILKSTQLWRRTPCKITTYISPECRLWIVLICNFCHCGTPNFEMVIQFFLLQPKAETSC